MLSKVSASSFSSSAGPLRPIRWWRSEASSSRAVAVIACNGRRARFAISQPNSTASTTVISSAIADWTTSAVRVDER